MKKTFEIGQRVKITNSGHIYSTYENMFIKMGFRNTKVNNVVKCREGRVFAKDMHDEQGIILYGVLLFDGEEILIGENGLEEVLNVEMVKISEGYDALITSTGIIVGCQVINKETLEEIISKSKKTGLI